MPRDNIIATRHTSDDMHEGAYKIRPTGTAPDGSTAEGATVEPRLPVSVEWPTVLVAAAIWTGLGIVLATHEMAPWWLTVPLLVYLAGWYASLRHEVAHGHPTPWPAVNHSLVAVPLDFVYPFTRFRDLHLEHHRDPSTLTDPITDTESRYCSAEAWDRAGPVGRLLMRLDRTLLGWLTIGVVRSAIRYLASDLRLAVSNRRLGRIWACHVVGCGATAYLIVGLIGLPVFQLVVGLVYGRTVCTGMRTFAEHRWMPDGATRSAVVRAGPLLSLLYLNNNLHHTHHARPGAAWYALPRLHRSLGSDAISDAGAGLYRGGYVEQWRRFAVRSFCRPVHPGQKI